jgi:hypothetical protein
VSDGSSARCTSDSPCRGSRSIRQQPRTARRVLAAGGRAEPSDHGEADQQQYQERMAASSASNVSALARTAGCGDRPRENPSEKPATRVFLHEAAQPTGRRPRLLPAGGDGPGLGEATSRRCAPPRRSARLEPVVRAAADNPRPPAHRLPPVLRLTQLVRQARRSPPAEQTAALPPHRGGPRTAPSRTPHPAPLDDDDVAPVVVLSHFNAPPGTPASPSNVPPAPASKPGLPPGIPTDLRKSSRPSRQSSGACPAPPVLIERIDPIPDTA